MTFHQHIDLKPLTVEVIRQFKAMCDAERSTGGKACQCGMSAQDSQRWRDVFDRTGRK